MLNACSSTTRGIWIAGIIPWGTNQIDYVTLASTGDAADFGDYGNAGYGVGSCSNGSRYVGSGGSAEGTKMYYGDIAVTGQTSASFGDISTTWGTSTMWSNTVRGVMNNTTKNHYITIATLGDSASFGDVYDTRELNLAGSSSNGPRGVQMGGTYAATDNILYQEMMTLGDSAIFGTMTENPSDYVSGSSGRPT